MLSSKRGDLETLASRLPLMPAHDSLFLLRNVVTTPRLMYTLRTAPCTGSKELELATTRCCGQPCPATLSMDLSDEGWQQASLPVRWGGLGVRSAVMLAPSAYLASAASTATLVLKLLPSCLHHISDRSTPNTLAAWQSAVEPAALAPVDLAATRQRSWDGPMLPASVDTAAELSGERPRESSTRASLTATSGAWLQALPISSVGLRMDDDASSGWLWVCVLAPICANHTCAHAVSLWMPVAPRVGLQEKRTPATACSNDVVWRAMLRAQVPSCKEPAGLSRSDGKRPDGVSLIPWS